LEDVVWDAENRQLPKFGIDGETEVVFYHQFPLAMRLLSQVTYGFEN
jgi:hypothetical protein